MWIFLSNAMLSIVAAPSGGPNGKRKELLVRARVKGDIERIFPRHKASHTPNRDYHYRAIIPAGTVAHVIGEHLLSVEYTNFKGSVREPDRHDAYVSVWAAMHRFQEQRQRRFLPLFDGRARRPGRGSK